MSEKTKFNALTDHHDFHEVVDKLFAALRPQKQKISFFNALSAQKREELTTAFNRTSMARGTFLQYMEDLAKLIGHKYVTDFVILDSPKDLEKAAEKMFDEDRNMHDLNRGRVLFTSYEQYELFIRRFVQKKGSKKFHEKWQDKITIIEGKQDDYLKKCRESGYAGAYHFDVQVDCGKDQKCAELEIQMMPKDMVDTYDLSHHLYDLIRVIEYESKKRDLSDAENTVLRALITANTALWDLAAINTGFIQARERPRPEYISEQDYAEASTLITVFQGRLYANDEDKRTKKEHGLIEALEEASYALNAVYHLQKQHRPDMPRGLDETLEN
ncbi:MAG: hypothetical protein KDI11_00765 [Alphaproteobacteria bacterium]|nr:hypothetical protein [Alphaproteobacteria bacterium]